MPRKTDSNNPADWLWIAQSDLEGLRHLANAEIAYGMCRSKLSEVLEKVIKAELIRLAGSSRRPTSCRGWRVNWRPDNPA